MWKLKVLSGLHRHQTFDLNEGTNKLGRSEDNDLCLSDPGISKNHAHIVINNNLVSIVDQNSSNGSFVDGAKITQHIVKTHSRITFYNVLCQVVYEAAPSNEAQLEVPEAGEIAEAPEASPALDNTNPDAWQQTLGYLQENVLPALYSLTRFMDLKWALALLIAVFVFVSTALSALPSLRSLSQSTQTQARLQAQSVAQQLALQNASAIANVRHSDLQLHTASRRQGVRAAYIVSNEGRVLAPAQMAGQYLNLDYVHTGRKFNKASASKIKKGLLVAMHPIEKLNPELQVNQIAAFAVVQFESLAINTSYLISLLIQNFFIILVLGALLFAFIYLLVKYPIEKINEQISEALQKNTNEIGFEYKFEAFNDLSTHVQSLVARAQSAKSEGDEALVEADRVSELTNLVSMVENGALAVLDTEQIVTANDDFYQITGLQPVDIENINLGDLNDQALKLNLQDLIEKSKGQPSQLAHNVLEFNGTDYTLMAQAVFGRQEVAYYIITFNKSSAEG